MTDVSLKFRTINKLGIEHQNPTVILRLTAIVGLTAKLPRPIGQQCVGLGGVFAHSIDYIGREISLREEGIYIVTIERMAYFSQLVVVYHRHVRVVNRCPDVVGVVIGRVDYE